MARTAPHCRCRLGQQQQQSKHHGRTEYWQSAPLLSSPAHPPPLTFTALHCIPLPAQSTPCYASKNSSLWKRSSSRCRCLALATPGSLPKPSPHPGWMPGTAGCPCLPPPPASPCPWPSWPTPACPHSTVHLLVGAWKLAGSWQEAGRKLAGSWQAWPILLLTACNPPWAGKARQPGGRPGMDNRLATLWPHCCVVLACWAAGKWVLSPNAPALCQPEAMVRSVQRAGGLGLVLYAARSHCQVTSHHITPSFGGHTGAAGRPAGAMGSVAVEPGCQYQRRHASGAAVYKLTGGGSAGRPLWHSGMEASCMGLRISQMSGHPLNRAQAHTVAWATAAWAWPQP
ncbi:hypothetical protein HaLaN_07558 [Haematococcus lacustris]|uniref:Uncharacterized protein n=1 Tax=Haematococcus lacustris TaxID=44745 RepID=A0A699YWJ9_HAELA|nr:hypothetical protein HaLaN_07558 [Haematococcus lacustris]